MKPNQVRQDNHHQPVVSPEWHEHALREAETEFAAGRIDTLDWESAKKELRQRFE